MRNILANLVGHVPDLYRERERETNQPTNKKNEPVTQHLGWFVFCCLYGLDFSKLDECFLRWRRWLIDIEREEESSSSMTGGHFARIGSLDRARGDTRWWRRRRERVQLVERRRQWHCRFAHDGQGTNKKKKVLFQRHKNLFGRRRKKLDPMGGGRLGLLCDRKNSLRG